MNEFSNKRILVIGDVMIDAYRIGKVERISPEAPVPIVSLVKKEERLGGAANVALNIASLGATPVLCTLIGEDEGGDRFVELMREKDMPTEGVIQKPNVKTTVKTRVIGNNQQLLRIDDERVNPSNESQEDLLIKRVAMLIEKGIDGIILEDYNKGVLTPKVIREVISLANESDIVTAVDPKKDNFFEYKNVTLFKPNLKELKEGLNVAFDVTDDKAVFEAAVAKMESQLNNKISFVTLSEHGVFIKDENNMHYVPAHLRNISDVSGAGDTVIAVATLCLASGLNIEQVARVSNLAGGIVCEWSGVVPLNRGTLMDELNKLKI
jgi:rfaE bifunctional protein kinase chain/domain